MTSQFTLVVVRGRTLQLQSVDACCQFDVFVSLHAILATKSFQHMNSGICAN
jgi:hypothetical protein